MHKQEAEQATKGTHARDASEYAATVQSSLSVLHGHCQSVRTAKHANGLLISIEQRKNKVTDESHHSLHHTHQAMSDWLLRHSTAMPIEHTDITTNGHQQTAYLPIFTASCSHNIHAPKHRML